MKSGIINVYKEKGFTSFDVVAKLKGILRERKIGHTGTLDPDAEGVLPVCVAKGTKLCALLTDQDKEYEAVLLLGQVTDTQDCSGKILEEHPVTVSEAAVWEAVQSFVGAYDQVPPMYSALKVNGKKLYELARKGVEVERAARRVTIHSIDILSVELPRVRMRVHCSKGTYIRTLCQDIGEKLGCGGCMESLLRTRVGRFGLEEAYRLSEIEAYAKEGRAEELILSSDQLFLDDPALSVRPELYRFADNGNVLLPEHFTEMPGELADGQQVRVYGRNQGFTGIYEYRKSRGDFHPVKLFLE